MNVSKFVVERLLPLVAITGGVAFACGSVLAFGVLVFGLVLILIAEVKDISDKLG